MATVPLQAAFRRDFVTLLVLVDDADTMDVVAHKVAYHVINRRMPASTRSRSSGWVASYQDFTVRSTSSRG